LQKSNKTCAFPKPYEYKRPNLYDQRSNHNPRRQSPRLKHVASLGGVI
jgi:hypothetical protein